PEENPLALRGIARIFDARGEKEASDYWEALLTIVPNDPEATGALGTLAKGNLAQINTSISLTPPMHQIANNFENSAETYELSEAAQESISDSSIAEHDEGSVSEATPTLATAQRRGQGELSPTEAMNHHPDTELHPVSANGADPLMNRKREGSQQPTSPPATGNFLLPQETRPNIGGAELAHQIWQRLNDASARAASPTGFLNDLAQLLDLREVTRDFDVSALAAPSIEAAEQSGHWRQWATLYEALFLNDAEDPDRSRHLFVLGVSWEETLGDPTRGAEFYHELLQLNPQHEEALQRLRLIFRRGERWGLLIKLLERLAGEQPEPLLRFELYRELGDLYEEKQGASAKAIAAWFQALELVPDSHEILIRLLEVYQRAGRWSASVKVLLKLAKQSVDEGKRAYYTYTAGLIQRDKLEDSYRAVRTFDDALDHDPTFLKAFQAIEDLLSAEGDAARQDRYYRKMLTRAVEHGLEASITAEIARRLWILNEELLENLDAAIQAYQVVIDLSPGDQQANAQLLKLKSQQEGPAAALSLAFKWIRRSPTSEDAYQALFRFAVDASDLDRAYCAAVVLNEIDAGSEESEALRSRARMSTRILRPLQEGDWRLLRWSLKGSDPEQLLSQYNAALLAGLSQPAQTLPFPLKRPPLRREKLGDLWTICEYISTITGWRVPQLREGVAGPWLQIACIDEEVQLFLSPKLLNSRSLEQLAAVMAYGLYLAQPGRWPLAMTSSKMAATELSETIEAAFRSAAGLPVRVQNEIIVRCAEQLRKETRGPQSELLMALPPAARWGLAVEQSALRAALLFSGSFSLCSALSGEVTLLSNDDLSARQYRLALFSVSPPYLELRRTLGLDCQR
ncbi:MAG: hypothetical protein VYD19_11545, partial [Myxococcota bacterium]|nr:hypothetical protein [Myxococcota bacterium]